MPFFIAGVVANIKARYFSIHSKSSHKPRTIHAQSSHNPGTVLSRYSHKPSPNPLTILAQYSHNLHIILAQTSHNPHKILSQLSHNPRTTPGRRCSSRTHCEDVITGTNVAHLKQHCQTSAHKSLELLNKSFSVL